MRWFRKINLKNNWPVIYSLVGSFIIAEGWDFYHLIHKPAWQSVLYTVLVGLGIFIAFQIFKRLYLWLTARYNRHIFWQTEFSGYLDKLFLIFSLTFVIFFSQSELFSLIYFAAIVIIFFIFLDRYLRRHPAAAPWLAVNRSFFILLIFIFILSGFFQYVAHQYYILDVNARIFNIVFFRAWAMTMFWLLGFAVAGLIYWHSKSWRRYAGLVFWSALYIFNLIIWAVNLGILVNSGLYFSPIVLAHAEGAGQVIRSYLLPVAIGFGALIFFIVSLVYVVRAHRRAPKRYWLFYSFSIIAVALVSLISLTSFKNSPELVILKNFYNFFAGDTGEVKLWPGVLEKLNKFGIHYNLKNFYLNHQDKIYSATTTLLSENFARQKPNVIIIFLESFSSRLTGVYNPRFVDLTPGLDQMAADPQTTIVKKYYNASTPTITGLMAQLCSFLPTTGHNEIEEEKKLQRHYLLCLPKILKESGGYKYTNYVTAVEKDYAHKDTIFGSMGVEDIYGTAELSKWISGEPLSWGYSDHQMYPAFWNIIQTRAKPPFLAMLSTVDTHPPFNLSKDMLVYGDGQDNLLNSIYTSDDAFKKFWQEFKQSPLASNTIVVAVADHAVFPTAYDPKTFPVEAGKMNFYDETMLMMYVPDSHLPKVVDMYSSSVDLAPTLAQILGINVPNAFEGHSLFDDRAKYQNILGMHEFGLYINQQIGTTSKRQEDYTLPTELVCPEPVHQIDTSTPLTMCEYQNFYHWKRQAFEQGRFWELK